IRNFFWNRALDDILCASPFQTGCVAGLMSDLELLFLILALIYGWECACWLPRGSVAFRTWFGKRWRLVNPGMLLGNQNGGFVFAHPLPPLGTILAATQFPLSLSPEAVLVHV